MVSVLFRGILNLFRREMVTLCFKSIYQMYPHKGPWLHLPTDVYDFMDMHWSILCAGQKPSGSLLGTVADTL